MKKVIGFLLVLAASSPLHATAQVFLRSSFPRVEHEDSQDALHGLRTIESASALANSGAVVLYAISPDFYEADPRVGDGGVNFIKQLSGTINNLAAYALMEQSPIMGCTRILEIIAQNPSWHTAPGWENMNAFKTFIKELVVASAHGVSAEVVCYLQGKGIDAILDEKIDRKVLRAVYVVATALAVGLVETGFNFIDQKVNGKEAVKGFMRIIGEQFYRELAFHIAGELIRRGVESPDKNDYFADLKFS